MAARATLPGPAGTQSFDQHDRLVSASTVLRQPDRGDGDEPAEYRSVAAARADQPGHVSRGRDPADLLVPDHCRNVAVRRAVGADRPAHPNGKLMSDLVVEAGAATEDRIAVASNWKLVWWRFRKTPRAVFSAVILAGFYLVVLCPDFFSTQSPEQTDARQAFIPVQTLHLFDDGGWNPWVPAIVGKRNPVTLRMKWTVDPAKQVRVRFFTPGSPYPILGLFPATTHLLAAASPGPRIY